MSFSDDDIKLADRTADTFGFGELGGIGQLIYNTFSFSDYKVDFDTAGDLVAIPVIDKDHSISLSDNEFSSTGKDILLGLCNLAKAIDNPAETRPCAEMIINWCKKHEHPYAVDEIWAEINDSNFNMETDAYLLEKDGTFSIKEFMTDLEKLYNAVRFYMAIEAVKKRKNKKALALYSEGRYFTGFPFFEKFKIGVYDEGVEIDYSDAKGDLVKEMQIANKYIDEHPDEVIVVAKNGFERFPQANIEELEDQLLDCFPNFNLRMRKSPRKNRVIFAVDVHSIFDIAWCSFARYIAEESIREQERTTGMTRKEDAIIIACKHCGKFMYRRNNRQEYCDKPECQKARNANNQRMFRERKRKEKAKQGLLI